MHTIIIKQNAMGESLSHRILLTREQPVGERAHPGQTVPPHRLVSGIENWIEHFVAEAIDILGQVIKIRKTLCFSECKGVGVPADLLCWAFRMHRTGLGSVVFASFLCYVPLAALNIVVP